MTLLGAWPWPGNVRQLENAVYRAVVMSDGGQLGVADFPLAGGAPAEGPEMAPLTLESPPQSPAANLVPAAEVPIAPAPAADRFPPSYGTLALIAADGEVRPLEEVEAEAIRFAIAHYRGQMSEVARRLKIGRSTLYRKLDAVAPGTEHDGPDR